MIHQSSYQTRRLIGQLQNNEEIISQLTRLCEEHSVRAAEVRISGALKSVELARFDADSKEYVKAHHGGPVEIITLHGNVATIGDQIVLRLDALVSSEQGFGVQLASGQLRRGVVSACEFVIDSFDDLAMTRGRDPQSGRMILSAIESTAPAQTPAAATNTPAPAPADQPSLSWGDVSAASTDPSSLRTPARAEAPTRKPDPAPVQTSLIEESEPESKSVARKEEPSRQAEPVRSPAPDVDHSILGGDEDSDFYDDDDDLPEMKPGDILDHPKLGRCRIMKVEEDDYAHIRLPRGKISKLILHIFDIQYKGQEDGRNVFSLRMRK